MSLAREDLLRGIWKENPTLVLTLGMCPTLAVTNSVANGLVMGIATTVVLCASCVFASMLRRAIPNQVRIATFVLIIATFVTVVDYLLAALVPVIHKALGAFIALIVVNCIILGRAEAFASQNGVWRSVLDGVGMGLGFCLALVMLGAVREVLGSGSLLGIDLFGQRYQDWVIMVLPSGGFFTFGFWLLFFNWWKKRRLAKAGQAAALVGAAR